MGFFSLPAVKIPESLFFWEKAEKEKINKIAIVTVILGINSLIFLLIERFKIFPKVELVNKHFYLVFTLRFKLNVSKSKIVFFSLHVCGFLLFKC